MSSLPTAAKGGLALLLAWAGLCNLWAFILFLAAALGGAPGAILGMRIFHHKTLHRSFTLGMPALLLLNLAVYGLLLYLLMNS